MLAQVLLFIFVLIYKYKFDEYQYDALQLLHAYIFYRKRFSNYNIVLYVFNFTANAKKGINLSKVYILII